MQSGGVAIMSKTTVTYFIQAKNTESANKVAERLRTTGGGGSVSVNKTSVTWSVSKKGMDSFVDALFKEGWVNTYTSSDMFDDYR